MAELYVERKKKSPVLWIVLALIILGVIGYLLWANQDKLDNNTTPAPATTTEQTTTTTTTPAPAPAPAQ